MTTQTATLPDPAAAQEFFSHKMQFTTGPVELNRKIKEKMDLNLIDVRAAEDYEKGHIPGAHNLPQERWSELDLLTRDKVNVLYCYSSVCHLAAAAAVEFASKGYPVMELDGGYESWTDHKLPTREEE